MRRLIIILISIMAIAYQPVTANASSLTGNDLVPKMLEYQKCMQGVDFSGAEAGFFIGYCSGICDATENLNDSLERVTFGQIAAVISKYIIENPEEWNEPAVVLIKRALMRAFQK